MINQIIVFAAFAFVGFSVVAVFNRWEIWGLDWFADQFVHFVPHFVLAGLTLSVLLGLTGSIVLSTVVLLVALLHLRFLVRFDHFVRSNDTPPADGGSRGLVRVTTANLWMKKRALEEIARAEINNNADIIALSEVPFTSLQELQRVFADYQYVTFFDQTPSGAILSSKMALISRVEPQSVTCHADPRYGSRVIVDALFELNGKEIRFFAVHPSSPGGPAKQKRRDAILYRLGDLVPRQKPFILLGDMNTTPWSRVFRRLPGKRVGDPRFESTWITGWPLIGLPIDHILVSEGIEALEYRVGSYIGSDHRPLVATLRLT